VNGWLFTEGEERGFEKVVGRTREGLILEEEVEMGLLSLLEERTELVESTEGGRALMVWCESVMRGEMGTIKKRSNRG
jgi:hypothetical protein